MPDRTYIDFDISFRPRPEGGYRVAAESEGAQNEGVLQVPFDAGEQKAIVETLDRSVAAVRARDSVAPGVTPPETPEDFKERMQIYGERLYDALFAGDIASSFRSLNDRVVKLPSPTGVRIRLRFDAAPELAALPWEYLYKKQNFLSLRDATPIVRHLDHPDPPQGPRLQPPVNVLLAVSKGGPPLDVDREIGLIKEALTSLEAKRLFNVVAVPATRAALANEMNGNKQHHVLHFMGHSGFEGAGTARKAFLQLDDGRVDAAFFTDRLDPTALRLAVLNSCNGARSVDDGFSALAHGFVSWGVMAVVAMQLKISDTAAKDFSRGLYGGIAEGWSVEASVARGRKEILGATSNPTEWGTPVLFTRGRESILFSFDLSSEQQAAQKSIAKLTEQAQLAINEKQWEIAIQRLQKIIDVRNAMFEQG